MITIFPKISFLLTIIILIGFFQVGEARKAKKTVYLSHMTQMSQQTAFLSKFDIGVGTGQIIVRLKKADNEYHKDFDGLSLNLAILMDTKFQHFKSLYSCEDRLPLYQQTIPVKFYDSFNARHEFKITNQDRQHIYYVYLYDCDSQKQNTKLNGTLTASLTMYNNGSHFGEDQNFFYGYVIIVGIWIGILCRFCCPVIKSVQRSDGFQKFIFYVGFLMLGLSYFYQALNMVLIYYNGEEISVLIYLHATLKNIAEAIIVTTLVSIAWGWSITHLKHDFTYIIIGTVISLINITCLIIQNVAQDLQQAHHKYDRMTGTIILILRLIILTIFIIGIFKSRSESVGKVKHFLGKFGIRGGCYLVAWPFAVIFAQCFLPNYLHNQVITITQELSHLLANAMLGYLFAFPTSDYQKVDKRQDYIFNPDA